MAMRTLLLTTVIAFTSAGLAWAQEARPSRLATANTHVRDAVRRWTEVGMRRACPSDVVDICVRQQIDGRVRDVLIPPVVAREQGAPTEIVSELHAG